MKSELHAIKNTGIGDPDHLQSIIARIERLEAQRRELGADVKEILLEAKTQKFDIKVIRKIIADRQRDPEEVAEEYEKIDSYLGMLADLPLGQYAIARG